MRPSTPSSPAGHRRGRFGGRRGWALALLAGALAAIGGYVAFHALTGESSEPASIAAAIDRFRALPAAARTLPASLRGRAPEPGVYVYDTRGSEVSHVLGTRRHVYPARTTITVSVTPDGCLRTRWDVLATRHDAVLACPASDGSRRLVNQSEAHEFAGHVDRRSYDCAPGAAWQPARLTAGARWSSACSIAGTTTADAGAVVGLRTLALDGRRIRTVLLRTTTRVVGDTAGTGMTLTWVLPDTRLVVRRAIANASTTDTIVGDVRYEERTTLMLTSPRPRR